MSHSSIITLCSSTTLRHSDRSGRGSPRRGRLRRAAGGESRSGGRSRPSSAPRPRGHRPGSRQMPGRWRCPVAPSRPARGCGALPGDRSSPDDSASASTRADVRIPQELVRNLGDGQYEGAYLKDGRYVVSVSKPGYESQSRMLFVYARIDFLPQS